MCSFTSTYMTGENVFVLFFILSFVSPGVCFYVVVNQLSKNKYVLELIKKILKSSRLFHENAI